MFNEKRQFQSPVLRRALLAMKLLGAFGADATMNQARAEEPRVEVSPEAPHQKTPEDVREEKIQKMAERQQLIDRMFKGIKVELALTDDPYFEEYSVKVNGVRVGRVEQSVELFAKKVDFYPLDSDVQFLEKLKKVVDATEVLYTFDNAEAKKDQEARWLKMIEQAEAEVSITVDSKAKQLINQWGGKVIGWVILDGKPGYQIAPTAAEMETPYFVDMNTTSLHIKAVGDNVLIVCTNKDGSVQNIFVIDGKVAE